ncbi:MULTISPECIES: hypothetical protein [unclassified Thermosynechococcus]|nr:MULTISPECIES: hypothetical protein [unclassified Thermosynechococcus]MDR7897110.1 hypothetical protein [Thermosynechococcus sp. JY1332]MDR7904508.1 hypothetical protein [Thermosynechococcus sp. JY1334]MDR7920989.1 hypothetical protein [Thermosynechococcus sp. HY213]MDR7992345.1 hypothetical protein [Thermosynechococcus sp. TG252]QSF49597.1 hypothetical protein JW907_02105 [Thermosynechococcus sp. TA-1]
MKFLYKLAALGLILVGFSTTLVACGGGGGGTDNQTPTESPSPQTPGQ